MATFPVFAFGENTLDALANARQEAAHWTVGDDRWCEAGEEYIVHIPLDKKKPPLLQCTLWLDTVDGTSL